jgi:hypothetical protein
MVEPSDNYVKAAMDKELDELASLSKGSRNEALNNAAIKLGRLDIDRGTLRQKLIDACESNGHLGEDGIHMVEGTIDSGFAFADAQGPRMVPEKSPEPARVSTLSEPEKTAPATTEPRESSPFGEYPPVDAGEWLFKADDTVVELWGKGDEILWAEGEAFLLAGGQGLGKSTLAGQLVRGQLGFQDEVLGLPVAKVDKPILYLAMDRPRQLRRSMRRQFSAEEMDAAKGRLLIRPGPPINDMAVDPTLLARMAEAVGAGVVYVDSLKDAAVGLSTDEVGALYNRARQSLLAIGCNICELHHIKKPNQDAGSNGSVSEVYGSTWITSGAGSIVTLSGEPGDLEVRFRHAKTPANEVGPWKILLDPDSGSFSVRKIDLLVLVRNAGQAGLDADTAAQWIYDCKRPNGSEKKKAERKLDAMVARGVLKRVEDRFGNPTWFEMERRLEEPPPPMAEGMF